MNINKKEKGYVLIIVLLLITLITSIIVSTTTRSMTNSNNQLFNIKRNKTYYLAVSGAEMVYAALIKDDAASILSDVGVSSALTVNSGLPTSNPITSVINNVMTQKNNMQIKDNKGTVVGFADVNVDLLALERSSSATYSNYCFRIYSTGKITNTSTNTQDRHIITMFVFKNNPNEVMIFDGRKERP